MPKLKLEMRLKVGGSDAAAAIVSIAVAAVAIHGSREHSVEALVALVFVSANLTIPRRSRRGEGA